MWSVWLEATLVASTSWSFPIACIALVWRTREKGTEFFCTTRRTKKNKVSLIRVSFWGAVIAYCSHSHPHSRNTSSHSSRRRRSLRSPAVRSRRSPGCSPGSSSCCSPGSSSAPPGLYKTAHCNHRRSAIVNAVTTEAPARPGGVFRSECTGGDTYLRDPCRDPRHIRCRHGCRTAAAGTPLWAGLF